MHVIAASHAGQTSGLPSAAVSAPVSAVPSAAAATAAVFFVQFALPLSYAKTIYSGVVHSGYSALIVSASSQVHS